MKKRRFICFLIVTMFILGFLISDVAFGQSSKLIDHPTYKRTLLREKVRSLLPDFLNVFNESERQKKMVPRHVNTFLNNPLFLRRSVPGTDDEFIGLLYVDKDFRTLFGADPFYTVLKSSREIDRLLNWFEAQGDGGTTRRTLSIVSGDNQSDEVGKQLAQPFVVGVLDEKKKPLQGTAVTFTITAGNGRLSVTRQSTDVYGQARTTLTLGPNRGRNTVRASVSGLTPQTFTATATGGIPILNKFSGDSQKGKPQTALGNPLVVLVTDQDGNARSGVDVTFRVIRGGRLSRTTAQTDDAGRAETTLTLGSELRIYQVKASVVGFPALTQTFTATAIDEIPTLPPMYWIEGNTIYYHPTGGVKTMFPVSVDGTLMGGLAVDTVGERSTGQRKREMARGASEGPTLRETTLNRLRIYWLFRMILLLVLTRAANVGFIGRSLIRKIRKSNVSTTLTVRIFKETSWNFRALQHLQITSPLMRKSVGSIGRRWGVSEGWPPMVRGKGIL